MEKYQLRETVETLLKEGHKVDIRTFGNSMLPFLRAASSVRLVLCELQTVRLGDVVAFRKEDTVIVHRVIRIVQEKDQIVLICKGDSNINPDAPVREEQFLGKVVAVKRRRRWVAMEKRSILTFLILHLGNGYSFPFWICKHVSAKWKKMLGVGPTNGTTF